MFVYKTANHDGIYVIITLKLLPDTLHNFDREGVVCKEHANVRINKAEIVSIETKEGATYEPTGSRMYDETSLNCEVKIGNVIEEPAFDTNLENVYGAGIRVFLSKDGARNYITSPMNGLRREYYDNGQVWREYVLKDGHFCGLYRTWYENGQQEAECTYKDGPFHGPFTQWYENGQKELEAFYEHGKEHGRYKQWYSNGQLCVEKNYEHGILHGSFTKWNDKGQKKSKINYLYGKHA